MKIRFGFTIAEILIVMCLISIVILSTMSILSPTTKIKQKEVTLKYAAVYNALNTAVKELVSDNETNPFTMENDEPDAQDEDGNPISEELVRAKFLCKGMEDYINSIKEHCPSPSTEKSAYLTDDASYLKDEDTDFKELKANIETINGMNIYISTMLNNADPEFNYFMVYVDLNAKEGQNDKKHTIKFDPSFKKMPDVYAFAIIPTGNAIPIGLAEYSRMLLPVKIEYVDNKKIKYSQIYSYHEAKHYAWGWYGYKDNQLIKPEFKEKIPYTYNDYIKTSLEKNGSKLYNGLNKAYSETYTDSINSYCNKEDVYGECNLKIFFDKYK